jgi:chemotaxis family two-component system sensor kinase Cph1
VKKTSEDFKVDLSSCDREPIHIPGAIQSFGALLALHPQTQKISYASANTEEIFGIAPEKLLDQEFADIFGHLSL